jgi:hypothetical protein
MSEADFSEFTDSWKELEYFDIEGTDKVRSTKGFFAKSQGLYLFSKIFRHIEEKTVGKVEVSEENWQMNFTMEDEPEAVEADEEDEEGTLPLQKKSFDAEVRLFAPANFDDQAEAEGSDEESAEIPKIYVQIQRNRGDIVAFGNFVKDLMEEGKLKVFVEKSE